MKFVTHRKRKSYRKSLLGCRNNYIFW